MKMQQEINLYRFLQHPKRQLFTLNLLVFVYISFAGLLMINFLFYYFYTSSLKKQEVALEVNVKQARLNLEKIKTKYPLIDLQDLEGSTQRLHKNLELQNEVVELLTKQPKFSNYLIALSYSIVRGSWLTEINLFSGGNEIELRGKALYTKLVSQFVDRLSIQPIFLNMLFNIQELVEEDNDVNFEVKSKVKTSK